jgi:hypothetical protein
MKNKQPTNCNQLQQLFLVYDLSELCSAALNKGRLFLLSHTVCFLAAKTLSNDWSELYNKSILVLCGAQHTLYHRGQADSKNSKNAYQNENAARVFCYLWIGLDIYEDRQTT